MAFELKPELNTMKILSRRIEKWYSTCQPSFVVIEHRIKTWRPLVIGREKEAT